MTKIEREALEFAGRNCEGPYDVRHLVALKNLTKKGLRG